MSSVSMPRRSCPSTAPTSSIPFTGEVARAKQCRTRCRFDREAQTKRLRTAERALAQLGRINPLALEEFSALEERHKFLTEQLEDLKNTRRDLLDIVREVDERVEQVFTEAYADTERAFEQTFARLFPGGEGRLVLTDPDDMLATGVEVEARPPGKKIKRLSLLSGGERSLVAVAFLVALFKARPSPFYILDEVEAALDDTNLGRLLEIYEELRENSQLLVITHQKRTMEVGDALYGVTMRGDGVSAVISQRLRESRAHLSTDGTMDGNQTTREDYVVWRQATTRWADDDVYGHMNNARTSSSSTPRSTPTWPRRPGSTSGRCRPWGWWPRWVVATSARSATRARSTSVSPRRRSGPPRSSTGSACSRAIPRAKGPRPRRRVASCTCTSTTPTAARVGGSTHPREIRRVVVPLIREYRSFRRVVGSRPFPGDEGAPWDPSWSYYCWRSRWQRPSSCMPPSPTAERTTP